MSNSLFGYLVAVGSLAMGVVMIVFADRLHRSVRQLNAGRFWTKNALYEAMTKPGLHTAMLQILGWSAVLVGVALLLAELFLR